jgi:hypothetical protein
MLIGALYSRFHHVLDALLELYKTEVTLYPKGGTELPRRYRKDPKFHPFLKDALGAVDGTHIAAKVPEKTMDPFRNRKGSLSQNVMAVCDFDMYFLYVLPGYEGSAADGSVFQEAFNWQFEVPRGKYYLGDAGYALQDTLLVPFRGVRYHLREQARSKLQPATPEEVFNLRHSQMRNVIERIFGVLKQRFQILAKPLEYSVDDQAKLVFALTALHNFIRRRMRGQEDKYYKAADKERRRQAAQRERAMRARALTDRMAGESLDCKSWRDKIAADMWAQRQSYKGKSR